jgi:GNAT superfamily N-acetyltransferase
VRRALGNGYELDDDPLRIDLEAVHAYISGESYWGAGRSREMMQRAISGSSRVLGVYRESQRTGLLQSEQVGFARSISDGALIAYLADVYVLPGHRGRGLGFELVREMISGGEERRDGALPSVRWLLHTVDAQGLYARFGFTDAPSPYPLMERPRSHGVEPLSPGPQ